MSPPSSTATVTGGAGLLPSLVLVAADFAGGWSGCSEKSAGVKSSRTELSEASRFLYAAWTSLGPIGTSRGTSRYGNTCSATRLKTGAATDRKSTRLNSSHGYISYAVFCLKKKTKTDHEPTHGRLTTAARPQ